MTDDSFSFNHGPAIHSAPSYVRITKPPVRDIFLDYLEQVELPRLERQRKTAKYIFVSLCVATAGITTFLLGVILT